MRATVVKLGGSTADHKEMDVWTAALAGSGLPLVIVPGGPTFADQVHDEQRLADGWENAKLPLEANQPYPGSD